MVPIHKDEMVAFHTNHAVSTTSTHSGDEECNRGFFTWKSLACLFRRVRVCGTEGATGWNYRILHEQ